MWITGTSAARCIPTPRHTNDRVTGAANWQMQHQFSIFIQFLHLNLQTPTDGRTFDSPQNREKWSDATTHCGKRIIMLCRKSFPPNSIYERECIFPIRSIGRSHLFVCYFFAWSREKFKLYQFDVCSHWNWYFIHVSPFCDRINRSPTMFSPNLFSHSISSIRVARDTWQTCSYIILIKFMCELCTHAKYENNKKATALHPPATSLHGIDPQSFSLFPSNHATLDATTTTTENKNKSFRVRDSRSGIDRLHRHQCPSP